VKPELMMEALLECLMEEPKAQLVKKGQEWELAEMVGF
jgi:hypothetical protein